MSDYNPIYMDRSIELAIKAYEIGDVPVGAVVVKDQQIVGEGYNQKEKNQNTLHHAEIIAIEEAQKVLGDWRLNGCQIYSSCEPCIMCTGAIIHSRIDHLFFGVPEYKFGGVISQARLLDIDSLNHKVAYQHGYESEKISSLMRLFFKEIRNSSRPTTQ